MIQFDYIIRYLTPDTEQQDALFEELLQPENRRTEPWTARALGYLNHPLRETHAIAYIRRGLEELEEVQRTGDIFFPRNWVGALLSGHRSEEAYREVVAFLEENPDYPQLIIPERTRFASDLSIRIMPSMREAKDHHCIYTSRSRVR